MKFQANPTQALQLFSMLFGGSQDEREPMMSKAIVEKKDRDGLVKAGLIQTVKRGRASYLVLDDTAWDWVNNNLSASLPDKSQRAAPVLHRVLEKLAHHLARHDHSLKEFVQSEVPSAMRAELSKPNGVDLTAAVRSACLELANGKTKERIRLKDLRRRLDLGREVLDEALLRMQQSGGLVLMRLDNPAELTQEDESAALQIAGNPRHLVYLEA